MRKLLSILLALFILGAANNNIWSLQSETTQQPLSGNPASCWNEDDFHQRVWGGNLSTTFSATEHLCDYTTDGWTAGGIGLYGFISEYGKSIVPLRIQASDSTLRSAELVGTTKFHGQIRYDWAICWVPPYSISTNTGTDPLMGGIWTWIIDPSFTGGSFSAIIRMTDVPFQQMYCPADQRNLTP